MINKNFWRIILVMVLVLGMTAVDCRADTKTDMIISMLIDLNKDIVSAKASAQAVYWKMQQDRRLQILKTLADVMSGYEHLPAETRRDQYDAMLRSVIVANNDIHTLYTAWKPNALDGMDARYIGRVGSTPTGQYAMNFSRETGRLEGQVTSDLDDAMAYINGFNARKDRVETPFFGVVQRRTIFLLRMFVPIINPRTNEVVGGVGFTFDIAGVQHGLEEVLGTSDIIAIMSIYDNTGLIIASYVPERIGKNIRDVGTPYGNHINDVYQSVLRGESRQLDGYSPVLNSNVFIVLTPFQIGNSDKTWTVMFAATEEYMMREVNLLTR